jgi:hypothetical protein
MGPPSQVWDLADILKLYMTMGVTTHTMTISNAMDQFFTSVQMNDQLLQRMERSLQGSMANVESTAVESLLRPTQGLLWEVQELAGLVRHFDHQDISSSSANTQLVHELEDACEQLWCSVENVMTHIVSSRLLVRDFCAWLRHAGSQVKAKGTAMNSVLKENAKKRRVDQAVLERLVAVLNNKDLSMHSSKGISRHHQVGLSESLLNLKVVVSFVLSVSLYLRFHWRSLGY